MRKILTAALIAVCACASAFAGKTAYGYQYASKKNQSGFVSFDVDAPQTLTPQKSLSTYEDILCSAGEYVDGKIYTYTVELDEYYGIYPYGYRVYDAETLSKIRETNTLNRRVIDMTYDYTTNTMYALVEDKYTSGTVGATSLCVVDLETGEYRVIGGPGEIKAYDGYGKLVDDGLLTIACDASGQLYAMSHYRYLYKVDKFTGVAFNPAPQHNLGTASQFQTMAFDTDGTLWWAQQHPDYGHFCSIDLTTGIPGGFVDFTTDYEKLNKLGDDVQMTCLYFKDKEINKQSPLAVKSLTATAHANGVQKVDLKWELPTTDYSGNAAEVWGVRIYRIGNTEPIGITEAGATSFTDNNAPAGDITYEIIPFNASGNGFPAFVETFAGCDQLEAVQNISLAVDDRTATVSWEKPLATVNGGYADFDAITYNVYRCVGDKEQLINENTSETSFTETITEDGRFFYVIEPVCGRVKGKRAQSESFLLSSAVSIPYSTSFEDDQDGSQWTFINDGAKGWSIIKGYRAFDGKYAQGATGGSSDLGNDWLISPPINFSAPGLYILTFWANGGTVDLYTVDVLLGTDKSDVASFTKLIHSFVDAEVCDKDAGSSSSAQWLKCEYEFNVDAAGTYHVGFHNKTTATFANFCIDNLSLTAKPSGVTAIEEDAELAAPVYYNMQGVKVNNPTSGFYIVKRGNKVTKEYIR